ncbi:hypothetical protein D9M71_729760 [compost metagenome]
MDSTTSFGSGQPLKAWITNTTSIDTAPNVSTRLMGRRTSQSSLPARPNRVPVVIRKASMAKRLAPEAAFAKNDGCLPFAARSFVATVRIFCTWRFRFLPAGSSTTSPIYQSSFSCISNSASCLPASRYSFNQAGRLPLPLHV